MKEEEAAEGLVESLQLEIEKEGKVDGEGEEDGDGIQGELVVLELLTQDTEPSGTTLVDACNGSNELIHLAMLWTVRHRWPAGVMFAFN